MMDIVVQLQQSDFAAFQRQVIQRQRKPVRWLSALASGIAVFVLLSFFEDQGTTYDGVWFLVIGLSMGMLLTFFWLAYQSRRVSRLDPDGHVLGPQQIRLTEEGIETRKENCESRTSWSAVKAIEETKDHLFIFLDTIVAHIIPKRNLGSEEDKQRLDETFHRYVPHRVSGAPTIAPIVDGSTHADAGLPSSRFRGNLWTGMRLVLFQRVKADEFAFGIGQIAAFIIVELTILLWHDYLSATPDPVFNIYGVTSSATYYLLFFLSAFLIARALNDSGSANKFILIVLTSAPFTMLVYFTALWVLEQKELSAVVLEEWVWTAFVVWVCVLVFRIIRLVFNARRQQAISLSVLFWLLNFGTALILPNQTFWYSDYQSENDYKPIDVENTYYRQPKLLEAARVAPERPGVVDLYFVGFGSYASQDVFLSEVKYVQAQFDEKFDTKGRSVILVNNRQTLNQMPLANSSNLKYVLADISSKMNTEEDILFLFMTSHGSPNAKLSVSLWPLQPNDITAPQLRQMLDNSGIKWRVLLISACYSGSFLKALEDEHTLIITAAAKDKQSFGCSHEREFTYFGEEYFAKALHDNRSWIDAFKQAKATIKSREQKEGLTPSEPQLYVGQRIQAKLTEFERRLP